MPVALVTGASRGIGRAAALALADEGFAVAVLARSPAGLEETADLIVERGATAVSVVADITDPRAIHDAVAEIEKQAGEGISVLVNNAGTLRAVGPLWEVDPDDWWLDVRSSLGGTFTCCREIVPGMIERRAGRIINLTSYAAVHPTPYLTAYAAAKAGVASLTEALAASLDMYGIKAFAVSPGFTDTEMTRHLLESEAGRSWLPEMDKREPVDPERSSRLIAWLAGGAGDALNGRFLHALDDVDELLARIREILRDDLYTLRLRRLPEDTD